MTEQCYIHILETVLAPALTHFVVNKEIVSQQDGDIHYTE